MNLWLPGHRLTMTAKGRWSTRPTEKLQHRFSTKNSNMHRAASSSVRVRIETGWRAAQLGQPQTEEEKQRQ